MLHFFRRPIVLLVGSVLLLIGLVHPVLADNAEPVSLTLLQQKAQVRLEEHSSNLNVNWDDLTQTPNYLDKQRCNASIVIR